ncbi:hypothetical protein K3179_01560 [Qipengyuania sp. GH38]|uniref:hypothetical protein n=1 Tax=Qipengyuania intermedia TaxID=2867244 RepID=UPI001C88A493|nr:hypothetical protein [Qipengyuania intermedia]MBX7513227.1 hypothetical protein [Qipengyuania intermedia]
MGFCLVVLVLVEIFKESLPFLPLYLLKTQDIPILIGLSIALLGGRMIGKNPGVSASLGRVRKAALNLPMHLMIPLVALIALAGAFGILGAYPLSMDEYWARADGYALASGQAMGAIPAEFADYAYAMQPIFSRISGDATHWASTYLPLNALFQGLLGPFASPLFAAGAIWMTVLVARRHLPEEEALPTISVVLAATSAQWVITGMTTYAMSAHLFFNMAWLALVYRSGTLSQLLAGIVAVIAIGLHQFAFFPIFAGFFVLDLFLSGRRRAAIGQGVVIMVGVAFWMMWNSLSYKLVGAVPPGGDGRAPVSVTETVITLLSRNDFSAVATMGLNLVRFQLWQNPLTLPLMALAIPVAWKLKGFWRACVLSIVATIIFMTVIIPYQGHGWGYRYLHQLLGIVTLLAALGWVKLRLDTSNAGRAIFGAGVLAGLLLLPLRFYQAHSFVQPWAEANKRLSEMEVDIVLVDAPNHLFSNDLVRNIPMEASGPVRMARAALTDGQVASLCDRYSVKVFDDGEAAKAGLPSLDEAIHFDANSSACSSTDIGER